MEYVKTKGYGKYCIIQLLRFSCARKGDTDSHEQEIVLAVSKTIPEIYFKIVVIVVLKHTLNSR